MVGFYWGAFLLNFYCTDCFIFVVSCMDFFMVTEDLCKADWGRCGRFVFESDLFVDEILF